MIEHVRSTTQVIRAMAMYREIVSRIRVPSSNNQDITWAKNMCRILGCMTIQAECRALENHWRRWQRWNVRHRSLHTMPIWNEFSEIKVKSFLFEDAKSSTYLETLDECKCLQLHCIPIVNLLLPSPLHLHHRDVSVRFTNREQNHTTISEQYVFKNKSTVLRSTTTTSSRQKYHYKRDL